MPDVVVETPAPAVTEAPAVETPPAAPEAPPKPKLGEFARKAQAERERVQKATAEKAEAQRASLAEKERDDLKARLAEMEGRRASYTKNPLQALQDAFPGMDPVKAFELLGEAARNHGKAPVSAETYELRQKMEALEAQREADRKEAAETATKAAKEQAAAAEATFKSEISEFIEANGDTFELVKTYAQAEAVFATIEAHHAKTGKILPTKEAAALVEAKLEELVEKALATKKLAAKIKPPVPPEDKAPKTLTNDLAAQAKFDTSPAQNERERMARAMAALEKLGI